MKSVALITSDNQKDESEKDWGEHLAYIESSLIAKSGIADHIIAENHEIGECHLLKEICHPYKLDAAESLFITKHWNDVNCVNSSTPPIQSPLFLSYNKNYSHLFFSTNPNSDDECNLHSIYTYKF